MAGILPSSASALLAPLHVNGNGVIGSGVTSLAPGDVLTVANQIGAAYYYCITF